MFPGTLMIAEESTAYAGVTKPIGEGGLGFDFKWNMGWMHDTLQYFTKDPIHRKYHHHSLTFGMVYQYSESFVQTFSHDEVVHGKGSLVRKMAAGPVHLDVGLAGQEVPVHGAGLCADLGMGVRRQFAVGFAGL
jgi:1,4-alpha-glucan branching enzyme